MYILHSPRIEQLRAALAAKLSLAEIAQSSKISDLEARYRREAAECEAEIATLMRKAESR
jgi:hypothetical protein